MFCGALDQALFLVQNSDEKNTCKFLHERRETSIQLSVSKKEKFSHQVMWAFYAYLSSPMQKLTRNATLLRTWTLSC